MYVKSDPKIEQKFDYTGQKYKLLYLQLIDNKTEYNPRDPL